MIILTQSPFPKCLLSAHFRDVVGAGVEDYEWNQHQEEDKQVQLQSAMGMGISSIEWKSNTCISITTHNTHCNSSTQPHTLYACTQYTHIPPHTWTHLYTHTPLWYLGVVPHQMGQGTSVSEQWTGRGGVESVLVEGKE